MVAEIAARIAKRLAVCCTVIALMGPIAAAPLALCQQDLCRCNPCHCGPACPCGQAEVRIANESEARTLASPNSLAPATCRTSTPTSVVYWAKSVAKVGAPRGPPL
ncbi:MAG: hypothetical protein JNM28_03610 [Armatimonadetes bacterium]|nr:hypothetical protein [Armatimonadota bacterium]